MILGIIRGSTPENIVPVIEAAYAGGLKDIEITLNSPAALEQIKLVSRKMTVGAGTVLDLKEAKKAIKAGARFIVSPLIDPALISYCKKESIPVYPGAATPNEIYQAWRLGATLVKVFPVKCFGGPAYIRELKGPFPDLKVLAVGGVAPDNIKEYFAAGVAGVAVGASVFRPEWLAAGDFAAITAKVRELVSSRG